MSVDNIFEQIKRKLSLLEYVSKVMQLKSHGTKYVGLCPFHSEKTPSFQVDSVKDLFYCFGCNCGGDLFEFYSKFHRVSKKDAMFNLANLCGIEIHTKEKQTPINRNNFLLSKLKEFFIKSLKPEHIEFLKARGVSESFIKKFELGWAGSRKEIVQFIKQENLDIEHLGFTYAFLGIFENRIVFPIFDAYGRISSFGGRTLGSSTAKYINGAASDHFNKSQILYGANFAKKNQKLYITEGYLDVILLYQNGYNAVAPMGTAFTLDHLKLALEISPHLILAMDGDDAGRNSARKIAYLALEHLKLGVQIDIIEFLEKEDAASYLQKNPKLEEIKSIPLYEYIFNQEMAGLEEDGKKNTATPEKNAIIFNNLMELIKKIPDPILQQEYRKKWKNLWWTKDRRNAIPKYAQKISVDVLSLLLFKYVLVYPQILDDVAEHFIKLPLEEEFNQNLMLLLNEKKVDESLSKRVYALGIQDGVDSAHKALQEWYKIANRLEDEYSDEKNNRVSNFSTNFSQQEWEKFKRWLEMKEKE